MLVFKKHVIHVLFPAYGTSALTAATAAWTRCTRCGCRATETKEKTADITDGPPVAMRPELPCGFLQCFGEGYALFLPLLSGPLGFAVAAPCVGCSLFCQVFVCRTISHGADSTNERATPVNVKMNRQISSFTCPVATGQRAD